MTEREQARLEIKAKLDSADHETLTTWFVDALSCYTDRECEVLRARANRRPSIMQRLRVQFGI